MESWQAFLKTDLRERQARNPGYSLRSYAASLGVSPGQVSSILTGRKKVSAGLALKMASVLGVTPSETIALIEAKPTRAKSNRILESSEFAPISQWYHYAILGLASLKVNQADPAWIAAKLKIHSQLACEAFDALLKSGHIEINRGQFRQISRPLRTRDDLPSALVRRYHRQVMHLGAQKIETVPVEKREFSSMAIAIDPKRINAAKKMIREFKEQFSSELSVGAKSEVYYFAVQFFPVTEPK